MTEEAKRVVELLNKEPIKQNLNLISFHSLEPEQLLQLLNDVLGVIDPKEGGDIREEASDARTTRTLTCLRNLKYSPTNIDVSSFRQGIVLGEKPIVHPILLYLLTNLDALKLRAYLARYLVKLQVPDELLHDSSDVALQDTWTKYFELQTHFAGIHKELAEIKKQSHGTSEVKNDIKTMEEEKENLTRKVDRIKKKAEGTPDFTETLQVAKKMRREKERGTDLQGKIQQQRRLMQSAEQRLQRTRQQLYEMKQAGADSSPESLISRMEEDNKINLYLLEDKLPKECAAKKKLYNDLKKVAMEPISQQDLMVIQDEIDDTNVKINRLVEKRMINSNPAKDKLAMFRQQASILLHKKEHLAETVQRNREEEESIQKELFEKRKALQELGGEVLKGDEYKKYVTSLRSKSNQYKRNRAELAEFRSEHGVLSRTETVLQSLHAQTQGELSAHETRKGVKGFRDTQDELEKVSSMKSEMDDIKHRTLDDMSDMVKQLNAKVMEKKASLAPILKELRPMRQKCQELTLERDEKKMQYDGIAAGLESNRAQLEHSVSALREEVFVHDSRYYYLQSMIKISESKLERAAKEMKLYTTGDKKNSLREYYSKKIQEQENESKKLKDRQKSVRDNQQSNTQHSAMWKDLDSLLKLKLNLLEKKKGELTQHRNGGPPGFSASREGSQDRMLL